MSSDCVADLRARISFRNRASEMRAVIARLAATGVSSYDSIAVLSYNQAARPASANTTDLGPREPNPDSLD
jgi:hypothetical protein